MERLELGCPAGGRSGSCLGGCIGRLLQGGLKSPRQLMCAEFLLRTLPGTGSEVSHPLLVPLVASWAKLSSRAHGHGLLREELVPLLTEGRFEALTSELHAYYANV